MKSLLTITWILLVTSKVLSQNFDYHTEFKVLLENSKDKKSEYYYPKLLERFNSNDSTLTDKEMIALQIGVTNEKNYKPYETMIPEQEVLELFRTRVTKKQSKSVTNY
jgi:hypothetical protein